MKEGLYRRTYSGAHRYKCFIHETPGSGYPGATTVMKMMRPGFSLNRYMKRQPLLAALEMYRGDPDALRRMIESLAGFDGTVDFFVKAGDEASTEKRDIGSRAHAAAEAHVKGQPVKLDPAIEGHYEGFVKWLTDSRAVVKASEFMVISEKERYGATGDLVVWSVNGDSELWGIDIKTGGAYAETGMQLAAIRMADHAGRPGDPTEYAVPQTTKHGVLVMQADGCELVPYDIRPDREWRAFLAARDLYEYEKCMKEVIAA